MAYAQCHMLTKFNPGFATNAAERKSSYLVHPHRAFCWMLEDPAGIMEEVGSCCILALTHSEKARL